VLNVLQRSVPFTYEHRYYLKLNKSVFILFLRLILSSK